MEAEILTIITIIIFVIIGMWALGRTKGDIDAYNPDLWPEDRGKK